MQLNVQLDKSFQTIEKMSQGQLLEMQLLESWLLDTFFEKVICSTEKCQLLDKKKYAVRVPRVNFEQLIKKWNCTKFRADDKIIETVKYKSSFFSYKKET